MGYIRDISTTEDEMPIYEKVKVFDPSTIKDEWIGDKSYLKGIEDTLNIMIVWDYLDSFDAIDVALEVLTS